MTGSRDPGYRARMAEPGDLLAGRYRLDELIGRGGMATVFRAWDTQLGRPVAVKLLRPEIVTDPDLALRFRREAHAAAVLHHPAVVGYLGSGTDGSQPFLVMELVDGDDLATRIRNAAPLPPRTAVRIAADVASGLAVAHARGIVHRDVKPGNIILDARIGRGSPTSGSPGSPPSPRRRSPARPSARCITSARSRREDSRRAPPPTSTALGSCSTRCSPGRDRSRARRPRPSPSRGLAPRHRTRERSIQRCHLSSMRSSPGPSTRIPPPATRTVAHSPMPWSEPLQRPRHRRRPRSTRRARRPGSPSRR